MTPSQARSSKDWQASARAKAEVAQAEIERKQQLQRELQLLQERMKETDENIKRSHQEAAMAHQAAKDQEFLEISETKQADFRAMIADEVLTRVARRVSGDEDRKYLTAIMEGELGFESAIDLKIMLWEAIGGNDQEFLQFVAKNVLERVEKPITNNDLNAINQSITCLDAKFIVQQKQNNPFGPKPDDVLSDGAEKMDEEMTEHTVDATSHTSKTTMGNIDRKGVVIESDVSVEQQEIQQGPDEKREALPEIQSKKRSTMDEIELSSPMIARSSSTTQHDIAITDVLGTVISGEEDLEPSSVLDNTDRPHPYQDQTPLSLTPRKRSLEDETPSSDSIMTRKKGKLAIKPNPASNKFHIYIQGLERKGRLSSSDLNCSVCGGEAINPRVSAKCYHVYCNACLRKYKSDNGVQGRNGHRDARCGHSGCGGNLGTMTFVPQEWITHLRNMYFVVSEDADGKKILVVRSIPRDEMTDEE